MKFTSNNIRNYQSISESLVLILILSGALFLRIYRLENYPSQVHVDELSNIYDGYSISETGADRWGMKNPVILRGFGDSDYRPPLYAWLSAVSIRCLGYSIVAGRLPSVVFGVLSLILLFITAKKIGGKLFGYLSLFLATLSPWHITFSRIALESAVLPSFFAILTIYLFILVKDSSFRLHKVAFLGFCIGFATNDYQSTKLIFFIIAVLLLSYLVRYSLRKRQVACVFILCTALGASPQLFAAFAMPEHFFSRAAGTMMPFSFSFNYFSELLKNFYENLSPQYLFLNFGTYNNLTISRLLPVEMSFFYLGLFFLNRQLEDHKKLNPIYVYVLIVISILPGALTFDNPHALRTSGNIIIFPMITASGILAIYNFVGNRALRHAILLLISLLIIVNFTISIKKYINNFELSSVGQQNLLVRLGSKINRYQRSFENIYIEDIGNQPYIYIVSYSKVHPLAFQKMQKENDGVGWDHFKRVGTFHFVDSTTVIKHLNSPKSVNLGILKVKISGHSLIDSVGIHGEKLFFYRK